MQACRQPVSPPRPWPTSQPEAKQATSHPAGRPDSLPANWPPGCRPSTSCFLPCASLSLTLSLPSLLAPLSLSVSLPFPFALSLSLSVIVRHRQGVARRTHRVAVNWSSRNLGRWQGRHASRHRMRGRVGRQAGSQPAEQAEARSTASSCPGQTCSQKRVRRPASRMVVSQQGFGQATSRIDSQPPG